jgi:hypothetical protein
MLPAVRHTQEFERIAALPRRRVDPKDAEAWADVLTQEYACRGSGAKLRPWQAFSLAEIMQNSGAFLALPVGAGKTIVSWLAPLALGVERSVLVIPASLAEKTWADFASFRGEWLSPARPPVLVTREELARESNATLLDKLRPQLIMIDEADELANLKSSAVKRIDRYRTDHWDDCDVVALTGTPTRKSIMGYWHLIMWCLREKAPLPRTESEARIWAAALDFTTRDNFGRPKPGPLGPTLDAARKWYRSRLLETPGVVAIDGDSCDQPLTVRVRLALEDPKIDAHFERFLVDQENPAGIPVSDPLSRWRLDVQLGSGVVQYYDPPPHARWVECRKASAKFVRDRIEASARTSQPLDTEAQVFRRHASDPIVVAWKQVKPTFDAERSIKVEWVSDSALRSCQAWLAELDEPGIVWCGIVEFGEELQRRTKLSYYGPKGKDQNGRGLHVAPKGQSMICSWYANKKGFNLQAWPRQLIAQPPQSAKWLEQIFGRSHRSGQDRPVIVDVLATSGGTLDAFGAAIGEASFAKKTFGLTQKVLRCNVVGAIPTLTKSNRFRWATRGGSAEE